MGWTRWVGLGLLGLGLGCGDAADAAHEGPAADAGTDAAVGPDPSEALFASDHVVEIEIEIDPDAWEALRLEGRELIDAFGGCADPAFEYAYHEADVRIDGEQYSKVAVRKKGFLGSLSSLKPSLKIDLDRFDPELQHAGMTRLTLNNDRQDASHARQCLLYDLFRAQGLAAPRCNFAHVVVNGEDLGTYTHVESIKKPFLERHFDDAEGNLYEGQAADFFDYDVGRLQLKTNEMANDRDDVRALSAALEAPDAELLGALEPLVDLDYFYRYWALEVLAGHWDGYTGNSNNYYAYSDPSSGQFYFIPWGADGAFSPEGNPFAARNTARAVFADGRVARRLYEHPEGQRRYREVLGELLQDAWDEDAMLSEIERIDALLPDAHQAGVEALRAFVLSRRDEVQAELDGPAPTWNGRVTSFSQAPCVEGVPTSGTFSSAWGDLDNPFSDAPASLVTELDGQPFPTAVSSSAGQLDDETGSHPAARIWSSLPNGKLFLIQFIIPNPYFEPGTHPFHGFDVFGAVVLIDLATPDDYTLIGFIGDGELELTAASNEPGGRVEGRFEGRFIQIAPAGL